MERDVRSPATQLYLKSQELRILTLEELKMYLTPTHLSFGQPWTGQADDHCKSLPTGIFYSSLFHSTPILFYSILLYSIPFFENFI